MTIRYPQWREANETIKYPFEANATLVNDSGLPLLEGTFLDARLYPIGGQERMYLSQVTVTANQATVYIGDEDEDQRASGTFSLISPPALIKLEDAYGRPAGVIVSEPIRLSIFQSWGVGTHKFTAAQASFVAAVCVPTPEVGVRGILLEDGSFFTGEVWLLAEEGIVLSDETTTIDGVPVNVIRVDVIGDPLFRRKLCAGDIGFSTPRFVETITFAKSSNAILCDAGSTGNVHIGVSNLAAQDTIMRIRPVPEGLVIEAVGEKVEGP